MRSGVLIRRFFFPPGVRDPEFLGNIPFFCCDVRGCFVSVLTRPATGAPTIHLPFPSHRAQVSSFLCHSIPRLRVSCDRFAPFNPPSLLQSHPPLTSSSLHLKFSRTPKCGQPIFGSTLRKWSLSRLESLFRSPSSTGSILSFSQPPASTRAPPQPAPSNRFSAFSTGKNSM